jgi:hypothetical protein
MFSVHLVRLYCTVASKTPSSKYNDDITLLIERIHHISVDRLFSEKAVSWMWRTTGVMLMALMSLVSAQQDAENWKQTAHAEAYKTKKRQKCRLLTVLLFVKDSRFLSCKVRRRGYRTTILLYAKIKSLYTSSNNMRRWHLTISLFQTTRF